MAVDHAEEGAHDDVVGQGDRAIALLPALCRAKTFKVGALRVGQSEKHGRADWNGAATLDQGVFVEPTTPGTTRGRLGRCWRCCNQSRVL